MAKLQRPKSDEKDEFEAEVQVLSWIYEYTIKYGMDNLSNEIEAKFQAEGLQPDLQKGFGIIVRRLQIMKKNGIKKEGQRFLLHILKDLLRVQCFQRQNKFYRKVFKLYIKVKLLTLHKQHLTKDGVLKQFPLFNWEQIRQKFRISDDFFKMAFKAEVDAAHSALQSCHSRSQTVVHLDKELLSDCRTFIAKSLPRLLECLHSVFPCTALEKIVGDEDIQFFLSSEDVKAYNVLLNSLKENRIEDGIRRIIQLMQLKKTKGEKTNRKSKSTSRMDNIGKVAGTLIGPKCATIDGKERPVKRAKFHALKLVKSDKKIKDNDDKMSVGTENLDFLKGSLEMLNKVEFLKIPGASCKTERVTNDGVERRVRCDKLHAIRTARYSGKTASEHLGIPSINISENEDRVDLVELETLISELEMVVGFLKEKLNKERQKQHNRELDAGEPSCKHPRNLAGVSGTADPETAAGHSSIKCTTETHDISDTSRSHERNISSKSSVTESRKQSLFSRDIVSSTKRYTKQLGNNSNVMRIKQDMLEKQPSSSSKEMNDPVRISRCVEKNLVSEPGIQILDKDLEQRELKPSGSVSNPSVIILTGSSGNVSKIECNKRERDSFDGFADANRKHSSSTNNTSVLAFTRSSSSSSSEITCKQIKHNQSSKNDSKSESMHSSGTSNSSVIPQTGSCSSENQSKEGCLKVTEQSSSTSNSSLIPQTGSSGSDRRVSKDRLKVETERSSSTSNSSIIPQTGSGSSENNKECKQKLCQKTSDDGRTAETTHSNSPSNLSVTAVTGSDGTEKSAECSSNKARSESVMNEYSDDDDMTFLTANEFTDTTFVKSKGKRER